MEIIPGILEEKWSDIEKKINLIKSFAKTVHIDIIDGKFAANTTFLDPRPFKKYSQDLFLELHMMVDEPIDYLKSFAQAGFKRFLGHVEMMSSQNDFIAKAQTFGEAGLALDGPTPVSNIKVSFEQLDSLLIFTSDHVGFSGSHFEKEKLDKIQKIKKQSDIPIEVDGGIDEESILLAKNAGAVRFASTGFIFKSENPPCLQYQTLLNKISES